MTAERSRSAESAADVPRWHRWVIEGSWSAEGGRYQRRCMNCGRIEVLDRDTFFAEMQAHIDGYPANRDDQ